MKALCAVWPTLALASLCIGGSAAAEQPNASTADDLCPPSANPCVISKIVTIDPPGDLDFGLRDVVVTKDGRLRAERASILCGSFHVEGPELRTGIVIPDTDAYGSFSVTARRGCSLSPSTPCLQDSFCASHGFGTCSVGDGSIVLGAELDGRRRSGPDVEFRAAGDVEIAADMVLNGAGPGGDAGDLTLWSLGGDVRITDPIRIKPVAPQGDPYAGGTFGGDAGDLLVIAARDVDVSGPIDMNGADGGGDMSLHASRDLRIGHNLSRDALSGITAGRGGPGNMGAGRNMIVEPHGPAKDETLVTANGASHFYDYNGYSVWEGGRGGYTEIHTGGTFVVEHGAVFHSDSPRDSCADGIPYGGDFYIRADKGFLVDGTIASHAAGRCGRAGAIYLSSWYGDGAIGPHGLVDVSAPRAGRAVIRTEGNLDIRGTVDTGADTYTELHYGEAYSYGVGGRMSLYGDDLTVNGDLMLGGRDYGSSFYAESCRIRLASTALIDRRCPPDSEGYCGLSDGALNFSALQTMVADPGSRILGQDGDATEIRYYDPKRPPSLNGTIDPPPTLHSWGPLQHDGCPACGNGEIAGDETCDDYNVTDGDGCSADCVNESCIAQTPGYPAVPLCDDGSACTKDRCDPLPGVCLHEPACTDAFECTEQACVAEACVVTPVDALCDDLDPCTTDLCNTATGCVHAALVGIPCDDNDVCTAASTCQDGAGCVAPDPRPALHGRLTIDVRPNGRSDLLVARFDVPAAEVLAPLTESGVGLRLVDDGGNLLIDTRMAGALFSGDAGVDFDYSFDDPARSVAEAEGVTKLRVRRVSARKAAVHLRVRRDDLDAARRAGAFRLSIVFGPDPDISGCATLALDSCRFGNKINCRG